MRDLFAFAKEKLNKKAPANLEPTPLFFTNTLSGKKETFIPLKPGFATLYSCGPTVYSRAHIGNMRGYILSDLIARVLRENGLHVRQTINITDVGHLVGDSDEGEDKMEKSAREGGNSAADIAAHYTTIFLEDIQLLNIQTSEILFPRATEYVKEQIRMVQELEKKGFTYRIHDGVYFDTSLFADYGKLGGISDAELKTTSAANLHDQITVAVGRRIAENREKKHPADFALWKTSPAGARRQQEWSSPWGLGFPGWHIECSAMIRSLMGDVIDIHTGGIDLIPIHHNNEIAQSEGLFGKPFVKYWMHGAFLTIEGDKISKSLKNDFYVSDLTAKGIHPLALRYFFLQAHYRSPLSFSWEALAASAEGLNRLWKLCGNILVESKGVSVPIEQRKRIVSLLHDDLGTPQALAYLFEVLRDDELLAKEKLSVIQAAEPILGLSLLNPPEDARKRSMDEVPDAIQSLVKDREKARAARDFEKSDAIRAKLATRGYHVDDTPAGPVLSVIAPPNS
jgi:cysteinyl-tRNA synthetase